MTTTITEALAEIATIDKRIPKKAQDMLPYVARQEKVRDPFEKTGGSEKYLREQRQSYADLLTRKTELRRAISKANAETRINIGGREMTVAGWLVWKRECYQPYVQMLRGLLGQVQGARNAAQQHGMQLVKTGVEASPEDIVVCINEKALLEDIDETEEMYGTLDGLLSLKNATTTIEV